MDQAQQQKSTATTTTVEAEQQQQQQQQQQPLDLSFSALSEFSSYSGLEEHHNVHGVFHIEAPKFQPEENSRGTLDLVAVVDISGSMAGSKLNLCKETLKFLVNNLTSNDRLSVVTYNSNVSVLFPLTNMTSDKKQSTLEAIHGLNASASTNLSGGLFEGLEIMKSRADGDKATVSSVLLMTDGMANTGIRGKPLITMSQKLMGEDADYTIYTFGYGSNHNEDLLKDLSEVGNGMYYYIQNNEIIPESFADCLGGLLSVVAQNIKVTIRCVLEGVVLEKVHTTQRTVMSDDKRQATITLGDMQSEEKRDLLISYTLPKHFQSKNASDAEDDVDVEDMKMKTEEDEAEGEGKRSGVNVVAPLLAELSYANIITSAFDTLTQTLRVSRPMVEDPSDKNDRVRNLDVEKQVARVEVSNAMTRAMGHARRGSFTSATREIQTTMAQWGQSSQPYIQGLNSEMGDCLDGFSSATQWKAKGKYDATNMQQRHSRQRCNRVYDSDSDDSASEGESTLQYVSKARKVFRVKASKAKHGRK